MKKNYSLEHVRWIAERACVGVRVALGLPMSAAPRGRQEVTPMTGVAESLPAEGQGSTEVQIPKQSPWSPLTPHNHLK